MNLEDVIDPEYGLQQDEWSLSKPTFGKDGQLMVVGWSGKQGTNKIYITHCSVCKEDTELYDGGYFKTDKSKLLYDQLPCGCGKRLNIPYNKWDIYASRVALANGYSFVKFVNKKSMTDKLVLICGKHGEWSTGRLTTLKAGNGCPECKRDAASERRLSDESRILQFFATGNYPANTKFIRSPRVAKDGTKPYWFVTCPQCNETVESKSCHILVGNCSCACKKHNQRYAYILLLRNVNIPVAIKIGISNNCDRRIAIQSSKQTAFDIEVIGIWEFPSVASCKQAEQHCLSSVSERGIISKSDYPDGWTETVPISALSEVITTYNFFGGIKLNI